MCGVWFHIPWFFLVTLEGTVTTVSARSESLFLVMLPTTQPNMNVGSHSSFSLSTVNHFWQFHCFQQWQLSVTVSFIYHHYFSLSCFVLNHFYILYIPAHVLQKARHVGDSPFIQSDSLVGDSPLIHSNSLPPFRYRLLTQHIYQFRSLPF